MPALVVKSTLCVSISRSQMKYFAVHCICMYICVVSNITTIKLLRYYDGYKKKRLCGEKKKKKIYIRTSPRTARNRRHLPRHDKVTTEYCIYNIILLCFIIPPVQISSGLAVAAGTRSWHALNITCVLLSREMKGVCMFSLFWFLR